MVDSERCFAFIFMSHIENGFHWTLGGVLCGAMYIVIDWCPRCYARTLLCLWLGIAATVS